MGRSLGFVGEFEREHVLILIHNVCLDHLLRYFTTNIFDDY